MGAILRTVMALASGVCIGHYRIAAHIGSGGMGDVYSADDLHLKRRVALKTLRPDVVGDEMRRQRFDREAQAVAALNHPNIVTLYSAEHVDGVTFLTMELVEGRPLTNFVPTDGVTLDLFFRIAIPLADAVAAAHQRG